MVLGTKAALYRLRRASAVAFLDLDLHLLAPRLDAVDEALALMVRASRLVGARHTGPSTARVLVQTRVPEHGVVLAALRGEPAPVLAEETELRRASGLPPFSALALVSGAQAAPYAEVLRSAVSASTDSGGGAPRISVSEVDGGAFLVRAADHGALCDALAAAPRPAGPGLRVEVDPVSI